MCGIEAPLRGKGIGIASIGVRQGHTMKLPRRIFLQFAGATVAAPAFSGVATAQVYPSRPITMIVPAPAGGSLDVVGRVVAERMRVSLGQPIIVENVSGAEGT